MIQNLQPLGVNVPGGFGVTSAAYDAVLDRFQLRERLQTLLQDLDGKASVCAVSLQQLLNFLPFVLN
jgi:phosphoenolpyruvate synthase/pyruvate phosphate dikinase